MSVMARYCVCLMATARWRHRGRPGGSGPREKATRRIVFRRFPGGVVFLQCIFGKGYANLGCNREDISWGANMATSFVRALTSIAPVKTGVDCYYRSGVICGALLGLQVITTTQVLAQNSVNTPASQPTAAPPIVRLDVSGCTGVPPFIHCDVVTPQGRIIIQIPQDQIDTLSKLRTK
jgi:hypothetical protein